ncbi:hypothetical protein Tco_1017950 [Tanacetum coccineum]|uniref:Uncharacterized protein n=1 Tax=Tanacetum coccineum TaxID=301880 RepID=A0ABQ5FSY8_9ASTR
MTCIWSKLRGTAIKGHLSMVPIDMETQPIILVYIDVNLQRELALINNNIPNSAGARYGGELAPIFKKIGDKQTRSIPKVDISSLLQNASCIFAKGSKAESIMLQRSISEEEIAGLKQTFEMIDADIGHIT